jgi:3-dehydroquinate dehydratase-2
MTRTIHILNGPNLGLLGVREPHLYGTSTLADVERECRAIAEPEGFEVICRQTDAEHEMVHFIHEARVGAGGSSSIRRPFAMRVIRCWTR